MATKTLSNDFMQNIALEEAWKKLSGEFSWSETLLEKCQDKVDWDEISENQNIIWTIPMLRKFQKRVNWEKLSAYIDSDLLSETMIEAFKNLWNWHELSDHVDVTHELLAKFADRWDWAAVIDNYGNQNIFNNSAINFFELYKDHIPVSRLQGTCLWREIIDQQKNLLIKEITA